MWNGDNKIASSPTLIYNHAGSNFSASSMNLKYQSLDSSGSVYTDDATRKRKLEVLNQGLSISTTTVPSHPGSHIQNRKVGTSFPNLNPNFDKPQIDHSLKSGINVKQSSQFTESSCPVSQSGDNPGKDTHVSAISRAPGNGLHNSYVAPPAPPILQSKELSSIGTPAVIEIPRLPFSQHFTYNVATHIELRAFQPSQTDISTVTEKEHIRAMPAIDQTVRNHAMEVKHSKNAVPFYNRSTQTASEKGTCELDKNEIRVSSSLSDCISTRVPQGIWNDQGHNAGAGETLSKPDCTAAHFRGPLSSKYIVQTSSSGSLPLSAETYSQIEYNSTSTAVQPCDNQHSAPVDKSNSTTRNLNPPTATKLWDGTLQLSTSTVVSAVAFFKSGEKASQINWSQYIEVKGKVRLEAFEKFIQELPRSRSRALMVISLCWKVGSSETGLTCMKEITKIYKEGQRVGYAQLSPGTDLYVCPRSNTIITILAKYGFFKGMAAVEEDQDSLIGCVVWRRNLASSSAKVKEFKRFSSERSSDSPTEESGHQGVKPTLIPALTRESEKSQAILRSVDNTRRPEDNSSNPNPLLPVTLSVPDNNSILNVSTDPALVVDSTMGNNLNSVITTTEMQVKYGAIFPRTLLATSDLSASMKPDLDVNIKQPLLTVELPQETQNKQNSGDDDDLPEFDFDAACGALRALKEEISWSPVRTGVTVVQYSKQLNAEQGESLCEASKASEKIPPFKLQHFPSTSTAGDLSKAGNHLNEKAALQTTEASSKPTRKTGNDSSATQGLNIQSEQKKIWVYGDDDDDMPEWCPPDMDIRNSPSHSPPMFRNYPCYPSNRGCQNPQPSPLPLGPPPVSQLRQHQQGSESYQERIVSLPPQPSRLLDCHLASGHGFSQPQLAMPKYSSIIDHGRQALAPRMPAASHQSSEDSPPWSPLCKNSFQSAWKQVHMSPLDWKYAEGHHDWSKSTGNVSSKLPGNGYSRYDGKPDHNRHQHETSRGQYTDSNMKFDYQKFSPKYKRNEPSRRRPTGFDVLPNSPRSTPRGFDVSPSSPRTTHGHSREQYPRRRPSLFDVKPRDRSKHTR